MKRKLVATAGKLPVSFEDLVLHFPPRAIRDEVDYRNTQELIDRLTSVPSLTTGQEEYLDTLATLLHAYEEQHRPIDTADLKPAEMPKFLVEGYYDPYRRQACGARRLTVGAPLTMFRP